MTFLPVPCCFDQQRCGKPSVAVHEVSIDDFMFRAPFCEEHDALRNQAYYDRAGLRLKRTPVAPPNQAHDVLRKQREQPLPADVQAWLDPTD